MGYRHDISDNHRFYKFYNMSQNNISLIKHVILRLSTRNKILYAQPAFRPLHELFLFRTVSTILTTPLSRSMVFGRY